MDSTDDIAFDALRLRQLTSDDLSDLRLPSAVVTFIAPILHHNEMLLGFWAPGTDTFEFTRSTRKHALESYRH